MVISKQFIILGAFPRDLDTDPDIFIPLSGVGIPGLGRRRFDQIDYYESPAGLQARSDIRKQLPLTVGVQVVDDEGG